MERTTDIRAESEAAPKVPPRRAASAPGWPVVGSTIAMRKDPLGFLDRVFADPKLDAVYLKLGPYSGTLSRDPGHIRHILVDNAANYLKQTRAYHKSRIVLGQGLVTSEGELWQRQRRIAMPAFARQRVVAFVPTIVDATRRMLRSWETGNAAGQPLDVFQEMMRVTLRVALQTLLGVDAEEELDGLGRDVGVILERTNDIITNPLYPPMWVPLPKTVAFKAAVARLDAFIYQTIARRRAEMAGGAGPARDLLSMLMAARDEQGGGGMSDQQLRDEAVTTLIAGHETTANALSWTFHLLGQHPEWRVCVEREADAVLGERDPGFDDVPKLPQMRAVLDEAMRLFPPAWMVSRRAIEADAIGPYRIEPGEFVLISPYLNHRNPAVWDEPERFDPTRFLDGRVDSLPKGAYLPFGLGQRFCIGANFAMIEAVLMLAMVARRLSFDPLPGFPVERYAMITLRPKHGLKMVPKWRE